MKKREILVPVSRVDHKTLSTQVFWHKQRRLFVAQHASEMVEGAVLTEVEKAARAMLAGAVKYEWRKVILITSESRAGIIHHNRREPTESVGFKIEIERMEICEYKTGKRSVAERAFVRPCEDEFEAMVKEAWNEETKTAMRENRARNENLEDFYKGDAIVHDYTDELWEAAKAAKEHVRAFAEKVEHAGSDPEALRSFARWGSPSVWIAKDEKPAHGSARIRGMKKRHSSGA